jgi:enediyne biosynthesis protein E4
VRLLQNRARQKNMGAWLGVRLVGASGAEAVGATVTVEAGGRVQRRRSRTAGGFQAATPASLHFGLGKGVTEAKVTIHWPDGSTILMHDVACNAWLEVSKESGNATGGEK